MADVIVTGASGFLGGHVKLRFERAGHVVHTLKNLSNFATVSEWSRYAVEILKAIDLKAIINVGASQVGGDELAEICDLTNSNVVAPAFFASYLQRANAGAQLITMSTSWQYNSKGEFEPFNLYAASKAAQDCYLTHYALNGLKITSLVLFDTFSKEDNRKKIHSLIRDAVKNGEALDMTSGEQPINLTHVEDAAEAIYRAFELRECDSTVSAGLIRWAIKSPTTIKVKDLLTYVEKDAALSKIRLGARPHRDRERFAIYEDIPIVPGWNPTVNCEDVLRKMFS